MISIAYTCEHVRTRPALGALDGSCAGSVRHNMVVEVWGFDHGDGGKSGKDYQ
jgi:hypothetical protein